MPNNGNGVGNGNGNGWGNGNGNGNGNGWGSWGNGNGNGWGSWGNNDNDSGSQNSGDGESSAAEQNSESIADAIGAFFETLIAIGEAIHAAASGQEAEADTFEFVSEGEAEATAEDAETMNIIVDEPFFQPEQPAEMAMIVTTPEPEPAPVPEALPETLEFVEPRDDMLLPEGLKLMD